MLKRFIAFALIQRPLVLLAGVALLLAGAFVVPRLPVDAFPDISPTQVKLILKAPGMTPEEVEQRVIAPLEPELLGIPHQSILRSVAKYGIADITLDFAEGVDLYWARQQVGERFAAAAAELPGTVSGGLAPITTPLGDVFMFTVEGPLSLAERRSLIDWTIRPRLRVLPGVAEVNSLGGYVRTFEIAPDAAALTERGISIAQIAEAVRANLSSDGAGRVSSGEESLPVRVSASARTLEDIGAIALGSIAGSPIRVADIAEVRMGALTRYGAVTRNGEAEAAEGLVLALKGANARDVVRRVKAELEDIGRALPPGTTIRGFYDRGALVDRAIGSVSRALLEACVLVVVLLLLFLGDLRAALVVTVLLPTSVLTTFLVMDWIGLSANLMSLGGLAIAIGLLVDAGVVVVENVVERLAMVPTGPPAPRLHLVYRATREVAAPVCGGILIIAVVFLPLMTLQGLEGKLFRPVAITIVVALGASLLLSLTLIPVLTSWAIRNGSHADPWLMRWLGPAFGRLLPWCLARPRLVMTIVGAGMVGSIASLPFIGKSFLPTMDEGDVIVQLAKLPSISLEESLRIDLQVERSILQHVPEIQAVVARAGADELGLDPMGLNETDMFLQLKPRDQWRADKSRIVDDLRVLLGGFMGLEVVFTQPIDMRVSEMLTGTRGDVAVKIFGPDLKTLDGAARRVSQLLAQVPGAEDVLYVPNDGAQFLEVSLDRAAIGAAGVSALDVQQTLRGMIEGLRLGVIPVEGRREPLVLRADRSWRDDPGRLAGARVGPGVGALLGSVASIRTVNGPVKIQRENAARFAVVQANVRGRDLVGYVEEAQGRLARELQLPAGYRLTWGGQFENQQRAAGRLAVVIPLAMSLVFLLLFMTLGSVRQAGLVFANVPFALIGGVLALAISGQYLSVPAAVGFIALMGIAVLNGLVLVSHFNELIARGLAIEAAVQQGAMRRLRPVMMTASITALGLVPILLASGPGSEIQRPLAIVVIGGLVSSTALTLVVLPLLYRRFGASHEP
ncbi:MAG: efflux RND transporter permease subunit [Proteobacteria bacterium]|nr:efflux RND transporter permease subunit [Pseudomonadota bacterium]